MIIFGFALMVYSEHKDHTAETERKTKEREEGTTRV
jgi:hypothetical protein